MRTRADEQGRRWANVKLPADEVRALAHLASGHGLSTSALVSRIIDEWIAYKTGGEVTGETEGDTKKSPGD
jgi:hypothetical protein